MEFLANWLCYVKKILNILISCLFAVENLEHCDFIALRDMMIKTHLQDLKDVTNNTLYENYRCRKLGGLEPNKQQRVLNKWVKNLRTFLFCSRSMYTSMAVKLSWLKCFANFFDVFLLLLPFFPLSGARFSAIRLCGFFQSSTHIRTVGPNRRIVEVKSQ